MKRKKRWTQEDVKAGLKTLAMNRRNRKEVSVEEDEETCGATLEDVTAGLRALRAARNRKALLVEAPKPEDPEDPEDFKFKKGDVVRLKSGGPKMVIETRFHYDHVHPFVGYYCCYIHEGRVEKNEFAQEALETIP